MKKLKIAIVSPFPPGTGTLNEYAYHLVNHLKDKKDIEEITLISEKLEDGQEYPDIKGQATVRILQTWKFNAYSNVINIFRAIRKSQADVVLFNIHFLSFGDKKIAAALGLFLPLLLKIAGIKNMVLLHNIIESVDLEAAGITKNRMLKFLYNLTGTILTKALLCSDLVAVTIAKYVDVLQEKYKAENVALIPHGTFELPSTPDFNSDQDHKTVMTFGKFGTYKKVDQLITAVDNIRKRTNQKISLVIAGTDNPNKLGYLKSMQDEYSHVEDVTFTGYVEEEDVPRVFKESDIVVFPYTSTTGSSGVLHQAGSYGRACVLPNIGDLKELIEEEGYVGEYFNPGDGHTLEEAILRLVEDDDRRVKNARQNYAASCGLPMSEITDWYMLHLTALGRTGQQETQKQVSEQVKNSGMEAPLLS